MFRILRWCCNREECVCGHTHIRGVPIHRPRSKFGCSRGRVFKISLKHVMPYPHIQEQTIGLRFPGFRVPGKAVCDV